MKTGLLSALGLAIAASLALPSLASAQSAAVASFAPIGQSTGLGQVAEAVLNSVGVAAAPNTTSSTSGTGAE